MEAAAVGNLPTDGRKLIIKLLSLLSTTKVVFLLKRKTTVLQRDAVSEFICARSLNVTA